MTEDLLEENVVYDMVTNLHCSSCGAVVEVYHKKKPKVKLIEVEPVEEYTHDSEGC